MNKKVWTILLAMISTSVLADQPAAATATNAVAPAHEAAAAKPAKKKTSAQSKALPELRTVPLVLGPAVVAAKRVNVRGRAGLVGEVIGRLTNGEPVTVIEEVTLKHSKADEPSAWAKIALPASTHVWVHSSFLDRSTMTVKASKLNLRGGPGENFSVLGTLQKGDPITELGTKGDWTEIQAPANAYAFVAAQYLKQEPLAIVSNTEPAPTNTMAVAENQPVAPATEVPMEMPAATNEVAAAGTNEMTSTPEQPVVEPAPPRIVLREGIVRSTLSIQAPTKFELVSPDNFRPINYLFTTSPDLDLRRYKGLHIIVTGEEGLDERWRNTPVITIQRIQVIE